MKHGLLLLHERRCTYLLTYCSGLLQAGVHWYGQVTQLGGVVAGASTTTQYCKTVHGWPCHGSRVAPKHTKFPHPKPVDERIDHTLGVRQEVHVVDDGGTAEVGARRRVEG